MRPETIQGRMMLSAVPMTPAPTTATAAALPQEPARAKEIAAGTQTTGGPTMGIMEQNPAMTPQTTGSGRR